jgi:hypothetical protein
MKTRHRCSCKKVRKRGVDRRGRRDKGIYTMLKLLGIAHQCSPALQNDMTISALNKFFVEATETLKRYGVKFLRSESEPPIRALAKPTATENWNNSAMTRWTRTTHSLLNPVLRDCCHRWGTNPNTPAQKRQKENGAATTGLSNQLERTQIVYPVCH